MSSISEEFSTVILAYPDNPAGWIVMKTFLERKIPVKAVVYEAQSRRKKWNRFKRKVVKDGLMSACWRVRQTLRLRRSSETILDLASRAGIPSIPVGLFNSMECIRLLNSLKPDLLVIASAPILKPEIFQTARLGCLNAHPGWLPEYRGLGANAYALLKGDCPGVSVHFVDAGIDTGPVVIREKLTVRPGDTVDSINDRAVVRGAELLADAVLKVRDHQIVTIKSRTKGKHYKTMPFHEVRKLNNRLKKGGVPDAL